jgi:2-polyprenyl-3-methyl-5-hydroxy-6-metoxy-1,4-benzoquinol methylase
MIKTSPEERLSRKNAFDASLTMGVGRFHEKTGRNRHLTAEREALADSLVDPATGRLKPDLARDRNCPLCRGRFSQPLFVKAGFAHGRCPDCGLIYVNPVLNEEAARDYYLREKSWVRVLESEAQQEYDRLKYQYGLDAALAFIRPDRVRPISLLDIGAGSGLFASVARDQGIVTSVLEPNLENARKMRADGFTVIDTPLDEVGNMSRLFNLVTLWEVLEHIVHPREMLDHIHRIIDPAGVLLILVPNADALVTRLLHEKSGVFGGHSHVNFFNIKTLSRLLQETGFMVLHTETIITELGAINNYLDFQDPYSGRAEGLFECLTPELIHDRLWGSKLLVLAGPEKSEVKPGPLTNR